MEPPRQRRGRARVHRSRLAKELTLDLGALAAALLVIRILTAASHEATHTQFGRLALTATWPLVWPVAKLPGLGVALVGKLTAADLVALLAVVLLALGGVGVIAGWEAEERR